MSICVVVPFRGSIDELKECVDSIRSSIAVSFRILVFDDRDVFAKPDFIQENEYIPTGGIGLAAVVELSKSYINDDYVALLAGDDMMTRNRLQLQMKEIIKQESEICLAQMKKFINNQKTVLSMSGTPKIKRFTKSWLLLGPYGADGTIFMTRKFYLSKYVLDPNNSFSDWTIALSNYPKNIAFVPKDLVLYRQHKNQTTRKTRNELLESDVYACWVELFEDSFGLKPDIYSFLIIAAPWYRITINRNELENSLLPIQKILSHFRTSLYSNSERKSAERIIIRRFLFRLNVKNFIFVLYFLQCLEIRYVTPRIVYEVGTIVSSFLSLRGLKPRYIKIHQK